MAAPVHVQAVSAQSVGSVASLTTPTFVSTSGNLLAVTNGDAGAATYGASPISDNKSNTWTSAVARASVAGSGMGMFYAKNIAGGSGHTVTVTVTTNDQLVILVEEMSGADTVAPLDQHPAGNGVVNGVNPRNANSITPSQTNTLAVAGITHGAGSSNTFTATGTGTVRASQTATTSAPGALSTDTRTTTAAVTEGFNLSPDDTANYVVVVANFIGSAAAVTNPSPIIYAYSPN